MGRVRRLGRRVLSYPPVRRVAKGASDRYPALREVGNRVLGQNTKGTKRKVADIRPGPMFTPLQGRKLPIVVVVGIGLRAGDGVRLAEAVERAQLTTGTFRPLFVVDNGELAPFRHRNYAVEAVMAEESYRRVNPHDAYTEYLFERVNAITEAYGARAVLPVTPALLDEMPAHLLRLVGAVPRK